MQLGSRVSKKYSALNAWFIMEILTAFPTNSPAHDLLQPLFDEQYVVMDGKAVLRDKKEVKADSLQILTILMQPIVARTTRRCKAM